MIESSAAAGRPFWAAPLGCALIVALLSLPRLIFSARYGLIGDEAYYAVWSFDPGFGYFDHPPMIAWVIWLGRSLFGESEFAVRSFGYFASLVTCAALYRTGHLLADDRRIGAAAAIAYSVVPGLLLSFAVATPDAPSTLFWTLAIWSVAEFIRSRNANWWLLAGLFAGLGLLSKYTLAYLGIGLLLYLVTSQERRAWLRLWQVWAGGLLALALFAPVVWIDAQRGWISFAFQLGRSSLGEHRFEGFYEFARFLVEEAIQLLPTLFVFAIIGIVAFLARRARWLALPVLTSIPMLAYFLVHALFGRVNPNWTAPLFPQLALIGAWAMIAIRPAPPFLRWPLAALRLLHVPLGLAVTLLGLYAVETRTVPFVGPLPALNFVYGWPDLQGKLAAMADAHDARWIEVPSYSLLGWVGYYFRMAGDPRPVYQLNNPFRYTYRPSLPDALGNAPHLFVSPATDGLQPTRAGMTALGAVSRDHDGETLETYWVWSVP